MSTPGPPLTLEQFEEVVEMLKNGCSQREIVYLTGVSKGTVYNISKGLHTFCKGKAPIPKHRQRLKVNEQLLRTILNLLIEAATVGRKWVKLTIPVFCKRPDEWGEVITSEPSGVDGPYHIGCYSVSLISSWVFKEADKLGVILPITRQQLTELVKAGRKLEETISSNF